MANCPKCSTQNELGRGFCWQCYTALAEQLPVPEKKLQELTQSEWASIAYQTPETSHAHTPKKTFLKQLISFRGRITRRAFILLWVFYITIGCGLLFIALIDKATTFSMGVVNFGLVWGMAAASAKRFHDMNMSGYWAFIGFIPIIGLPIQFFINACFEGSSGPNRFGPDPREKPVDSLVVAPPAAGQ